MVAEKFKSPKTSDDVRHGCGCGEQKYQWVQAFYEENLGRSIHEQNVILIDELHTLIGAGGWKAQSTLNILKLALARGEIKSSGRLRLMSIKNISEKTRFRTSFCAQFMLTNLSRAHYGWNLKRPSQKTLWRHTIIGSTDAAIEAALLNYRFVILRYS